MDWQEWALKTKQEKVCTYEELSEMVNDKFDKDYHGESLRGALRRYKRNNLVVEENDDIDSSVSIKIEGDTQTSQRVVKMSGEQAKDKDFLLKAHGYDPKEWEIKKSESSMWGKKEDMLTSSKISVVPKKKNEADLDVLKEMLENLKPRKIKPKKMIDDGEYMLEIPLMDVHLGKLAFTEVSGEDYNSGIAKKCCFDAIEDILNYYKDKKIEKIIFPIGQDCINFDTPAGTTTGGTPQDNDLWWHQIFPYALDMYMTLIETLAEVAPVEVYYVPGNHDQVTSFYLVTALKAVYRNSDNITIENSPKRRKYIVYGKGLLGYTHGEKEKKNIYNLMQAEAPELWGQTKYREWHMGHKHIELLDEEGGIKYRNIPSMSGNDVYHYEHGYVGGIRTAMSFLWSKEKGVEVIKYSNVKN